MISNTRWRRLGECHRRKRVRDNRGRRVKDGVTVPEPRQRGVEFALAKELMRNCPSPGVTAVGFDADQHVFAGGVHVSA